MVAALGLFTQEQLDYLRQNYAKIERIDPCIDDGGYERLCDTLNMMSLPQLRQIAEAKIKWMSNLARNRVIQRERTNEDLIAAGRAGIR